MYYPTLLALSQVQIMYLSDVTLSFSICLLWNHLFISLFDCSFGTPGNPVKMAMANIEYKLPPRLQFQQLYHNLTAFLPSVSVRNVNTGLCTFFYFVVVCCVYVCVCIIYNRKLKAHMPLFSFLNPNQDQW
jgi:hypothetical protein